MNLTNIPAIRAQFAALNAEMKAAWQAITEDEYCTAWKEANAKRDALCQKYFGHDLWVDDEGLDEEMVLDWIEHFLKVSQ